MPHVPLLWVASAGRRAAPDVTKAPARGRAIAAGLVVVAAGAWFFARPGDGSAGPAGELRARLARGEASEEFAFHHRAAGTEVLRCVLPNQELRGLVDQAAGVAVLRAASGQEVVRRTPRQVLLHRLLFADGLIRSDWLQVELPVNPEAHVALTRVLGPELAGYALSVGLPASGAATAAAVSDAATAVETRGDARVNGRAVRRYEITLDPQRYNAKSAGPVERPSGGAALPPPVVDVWVTDDGEVVRVAVRAVRKEDGTAAVSTGWTIDYDAQPRPLGNVDMTPEGISALEDVDLAGLVAAPGGCEIRL